MGQYLALGLNNLIQLFDPALVVLAGTSIPAADFFIPALQRHLAAHANPQLRQPVISRLAPRAAALGACAAILQATFTLDGEKATK
jgi:predicted NBD/HSP70 family sugar kinase